MSLIIDAPPTASITSAEKDWQEVIVEDTSCLVKLETWRSGTDGKDQQVLSNLNLIKKYFAGKMEQFNKDKTQQMQMRSFEWEINDKEYWVFGFRAGVGSRKLSLICHLDTVPPGNYEWQPFVPRTEIRLYKGVPTPFLIGRGAIDDKGPAVVAFEAFTRALRKTSEYPQALDKVTLEVLFDTSEETDMSTPKYFGANPEEKPALGIVFDAFWSVRAEKGIERPIFTISSKDVPTPQTTALSIGKLLTTPGPANMIPVTSEAHITGTKESLKTFAANVDAWYRAYPFDDLNYHPADISVTPPDDSEVVVITAKVAGAQHGSAPHQNRANGANPVVSITNFLAYLVDRGILANNHNGEMCRFIRWAFGTRVFGENQPDLLSRFDTVFGEENGTTYALTQLIPNVDGTEIKLGIDIRYAIGHHGKGWDGSEGTIEGESVFKTVFEKLIERYQSEAVGANVTFHTETTTIFGPDIRSPRNANLFSINTAYRSAMGDNCPMQTIGGATDAHGWLELVTAGALFTDNLGPPVNYHGLDEGAPLTDLENSGKILLHLLLQELGIPVKKQSHYEGIHQGHGCCI